MCTRDTNHATDRGRPIIETRGTGLWWGLSANCPVYLYCIVSLLDWTTISVRLTLSDFIPSGSNLSFHSKSLQLESFTQYPLTSQKRERSLHYFRRLYTMYWAWTLRLMSCSQVLHAWPWVLAASRVTIGLCLLFLDNYEQEARRPHGRERCTGYDICSIRLNSMTVRAASYFLNQWLSALESKDTIVGFYSIIL